MAKNSLPSCALQLVISIVITEGLKNLFCSVPFDQFIRGKLDSPIITVLFKAFCLFDLPQCFSHNIFIGQRNKYYFIYVTVFSLTGDFFSLLFIA